MNEWNQFLSWESLWCFCRWIVRWRLSPVTETVAAAENWIRLFMFVSSAPRCSLWGLFFFTQFGWNTAQNTTPADEVGLRGQVEATGSVDEILKKFSHLVLLRRQPSFIGENKRDSVTWLITWPLLLLLLWLLLRNISLVNKWLGSEWKRSLRNKM